IDGSRRLARVGGEIMPTYMDVHEGMHVTPEQLAEAHQKDLEAQKGTGVEYTRYWLDSKAGKVFCLATGPNKQAVAAVHVKAGHRDGSRSFPSTTRHHRTCMALRAARGSSARCRGTHRCRSCTPARVISAHRRAGAVRRARGEDRGAFDTPRRAASAAATASRPPATGARRASRPRRGAPARSGNRRPGSWRGLD